jgi:hypothetical protein
MSGGNLPGVGSLGKQFDGLRATDDGGANRAMEFELDKDGYIGLPPGPGLGVEVDEKLLQSESFKPQSNRWPGAKLKDGSVADY